MKLGRKDYTISVKTGTDANKAKFKKECVQGEIYHATDTGFFYIAEVTAGASDATLSKFGAPAFANQYSVDFDGTDDYVDLGSSNVYANTSSAFSVSAWFKFDTFTNYPSLIQLKTNRSYSFMLSTSNVGTYSGVWFGSKDANGFKGFSTANTSLATTLSTGWHNVVFTYDGVDSQSSSSFAVYVDGSAVNCATPVGIGAYTNVNKIAVNTPTYFLINGLIDEVAIFNSELSSSNVSDIYNSGTPDDLSSYSPVGWWRMGDNDSGTGTTITDQGSGSNDGTLTNGPTFSTTVP